jgi:hypothetical protein
MTKHEIPMDVSLPTVVLERRPVNAVERAATGAELGLCQTYYTKACVFV